MVLWHKVSKRRVSSRRYRKACVGSRPGLSKRVWGFEHLEPRLVLDAAVQLDDFDSHRWISEAFGGDTNEVAWGSFYDREALEVRVTSSGGGYTVIRTDGFPAEDWSAKTALQADIYQAGGASGVDVKLEVRELNFNSAVESVYCNDLARGEWNTCTWLLNTSLPGYANVSHLSLVFDHLAGTQSAFYVDNIRLASGEVPEIWDDMNDGSRQWSYAGNWYDWLPEPEFGRELVTHNGGNPVTPTGSLYLEWDYAAGVNPALRSAEVGTSHLDDLRDWSGYNRIAADVKTSDPDVPISIFFWDSETSTGFGTPTRQASSAGTWERLVWDIPWPPSFDASDIDELKFVVNGIDQHTQGTLFLDNVQVLQDDLPSPVSGVDYRFASFERDDTITDFSSNWGGLQSDYLVTAMTETAGPNGSQACLRVDYALPSDNSTGLWFSLWGHSDYKTTQSIDFTDIFGDLREDKAFDQIHFWVRGSGLSQRKHNVKIELKDASDRFDRTAYRYIQIDDSDTNWRQIVLDADVTNGDFWSYNKAPPDPTSMKFMVFVVESAFNQYNGAPNGTFYIDNIQFVDGDDVPFDPEQETDDAFLDLVSKRAFLYFLDWYEPSTGLFHDRSEFPDLMSIASTGFGLTALTIGEHRGWIDRPLAITMIGQTLQTLWDGQSADDTFADALTDANGYKGFYYHFLDNEGKRKWNLATGEGSELSSVDTAILMAGVLTAREHFSDVPEITILADRLYARIDWDWMHDDLNGRFYLGWKPELDDQGEGRFEIPAPGGGYFSNFDDGRPLQWDYYTDEVLLINILAIGSPTHPVPRDVFYAWARNQGTYGGHELVHSWNGSFFTYVFAHLWIDFRNLGPDHPPQGGPVAVDWWDNSVEAAQASLQFALDYADDAPGDGDQRYAAYADGAWLTAADGPDDQYHAYGALPTDPGTTPEHDGTVAPYGAGSAILFTPEPAIAALKSYFTDTDAWNHRLGFGDALSLDPPDDGLPWYNRALFGIDNGPLLIAIENHRSGFVWEVLGRNPDVQRSLTSLFSPWHNGEDVNGDGWITPLDVLLVINYLNLHPGDPALPPTPVQPPPYYDVDADGYATASDALAVINSINAQIAGAFLPESEGWPAASDSRAAGRTPPAATPSTVRDDSDAVFRDVDFLFWIVDDELLFGV